MVSGGTIPTQGPPGRPLLSQAFIDERKRERCARALAEAAHELGGEKATVAQITKRAKISRATFYALFENQQAALHYTSQFGARRLQEAVEVAASGPGPWQTRVGAAMTGLLEIAREEPHLTEFCLGKPDDEGLVAVLAALLGEGRAEGGNPGPRTDELLARGILATVGDRLRRGDVASLAELDVSLAEIATAPFRNASREARAAAET
jgi:AcrR family transcriptional regulator